MRRIPVQRKRLILCIALPLAVGSASALLVPGSASYRAAFDALCPAMRMRVFQLVWCITYLLQGIALYCVSASGAPRSAISGARYAYALQLALSPVWFLLFFRIRAYAASFVCAVALWIAIVLTLIRFDRISKPAGCLLLPHMLWVAVNSYWNLCAYAHALTGK